MAVTAVVFWFSLILSVIGTNGEGEFRVLHSPNSLSFRGPLETRESSIKDIFSAALGLSVEENSDWNGLLINDPFATPEAGVDIYIDGISSLGDVAGLKGTIFPLIVDKYEPDTYAAIRHRIKQRFNNGDSKVISVKLSNEKEVMENFEIKPSAMTSKQTHKYLKKSVDEDAPFLAELDTLNAITEKVKSGFINADNSIDFYNVRCTSLHALSDIYGPNSPKTNEAKKLLGEALERLSDAFIRVYDGSVLVTVVTTDVAHTRRPVRSLRDTEPTKGPSDGSSAEFSAIFNIILWFVVVFTFSLIAIVYTMIDMDPGRDSIIYRMTSTRIKKDN